MATDQSLRDEVQGLRAAVEGLIDHLDEKVQTKVETEVAAKGIPREEYKRRVRASGRRTVAGMVLLLALLVVFIGWNRITLQQAQKAAQRDLSEQIVTCFLRPSGNTPAVTQACDRRFSDDTHSYLELQKRSAQAGKQFQDLQRWAKTKGWKPPP